MASEAEVLTAALALTVRDTGCLRAFGVVEHN